MAGKNKAAKPRGRKKPMVPIVEPADSPASDWVTSYEALGKIFGCHHKSFQRWKKITGAPEPRQNGDHSVSAWREFFEGNPQIEIERLDQARAAAELRIKEAKATISESEAAAVQGKFTETQKVIDAVRRCRSKLGFLQRKLLNEAPSDTAGKNLADRRIFFGKIYDDVMQAFSDLADEFEC